MSELIKVHNTTRTQGTIDKSKKLSKTVTKTETDIFLVQGSNFKNEFGETEIHNGYEVTVKEGKFVCKDLEKKDICQGWKFCRGDNKDCKHVLAVVIHLGIKIQIKEE